MKVKVFLRKEDVHKGWGVKKRHSRRRGRRDSENREKMRTVSIDVPFHEIIHVKFMPSV